MNRTAVSNPVVGMLFCTDHDVFVDLHLVGAGDFVVVSFEPVGIRVVVVALDRAIRIHRARFEDQRGCCDP